MRTALLMVIAGLLLCGCLPLDEAEACDHECEGVPDAARPACYAECMGQGDAS